MFRQKSARLSLLIGSVASVIAVAPDAFVAAAPAVQNAAVGTQSRDIVYNAAALKPFVTAAETRRVDIAGIGDSNQVGGSHGWDHGYSKAWSDRFGGYATGVFGTNAEGGWAGPHGYIDSWGSPYGAALIGAPAALHKYKLYYDSLNDASSDFPSTYAYFGPDYVEPTNRWSPMLAVRNGSPLWGQDLRWHLTYGTFDTGAGGFTPSASGQFLQKLYAGPRVSTSTGTVGLADGAFDIPASAYHPAAGDEVQLGLSYSGEGTMRGPFFGLWQRVEGTRASGVSYSTMLWQGGRGLVHAATALQGQSDDALKEYIRNAVKLQNGEKMLLVQVKHGQNDGAFEIPSLGPNPAPSHTTAGFADNMEAVIARLRGVWGAMGHDPKNLMFQFGGYHPTDGTYDDSGRTRVERLADWENAIIQLSQAHPEYNLAVVRGTRMTTPLTVDKNGWYASAEDHIHLNPEGFIGVSELDVRQAIGYAMVDELENRSNVTSLSFTFDSDVSADLSPDDLALYEVGSDVAMDPFDLAVDWDAQTNTATWTFQGLPLGELPVGEYDAVIRMSQLGGGVAGSADAVVNPGDYVFRFTASPIPEPGAIGVAGAVFAIAAMRRRARR